MRIGSGARDHFQACHYVLYHFVLEAGVQILGVLAENHHVDVRRR